MPRLRAKSYQWGLAQKSAAFHQIANRHVKICVPAAPVRYLGEGIGSKNILQEKQTRLHTQVTQTKKQNKSRAGWSEWDSRSRYFNSRAKPGTWLFVVHVYLFCKCKCALVDHSLQGLFRVNRLNWIGPIACEGAHGCRHTIHVWSRSTANPARSNCLGVGFVEGGKPEYLEKNPRSQVEIDCNWAHIWPEARIEPGLQRWEAWLMTTKPPTLPRFSTLPKGFPVL